MAQTTTPLALLSIKTELLLRGFGVLEVERADERTQLPLAEVDIRSRVVDRFAESTMTEVFRNPYPEHLEATYVFPLPGGAAVSRFEMHVAGRIIHGVVEERGEARRQYTEAIQAGKRAALLEKERDDVFTVKVGNLPPGDDVKVVITWSERLPYFDDGTTELRLPLVVAPRYIAGNAIDRDSVGTGTSPDTTVVPDASRITPPRLAEGFDPKVSLSIAVELAEDELDDIGCSQHATRMKLGNGAVVISLARESERLNRDFILKWRVAREKIRSRVWAHEGRAVLSIVPPRRDGFLGTPRDIIFVLDRSGSMSGTKMVSANRACAMLLATLGPRDRFAIQLFDDVAEWYDPRSGDVVAKAPPFMAADEAGIEKGEKFLRTVEARGGTELDQALSHALAHVDARADGAGRSPVVVLLTDGQIGDESRVLKRIQRELGDSRVFTIGIDTAVNEAFLRRLATAAGGTATFVTPGDSLEEALRAVGREIGAPLVVDVRVEGVDELAPSSIPDLFAGRATVAYFRVRDGAPLRVTGRFADGQPFEETVAQVATDLPAISQLWARTRIVDLEDRFRLEPHQQDRIKAEIIALSKAHQVLTRFTAFVVVDDEVVNKDGKSRAVTQPAEMPAEWQMEAAAPAQAAPMLLKRARGGGGLPFGAPPPAAMASGGAFEMADVADDLDDAAVSWGGAPAMDAFCEAEAPPSLSPPTGSLAPPPPPPMRGPARPSLQQSSTPASMRPVPPPSPAPQAPPTSPLPLGGAGLFRAKKEKADASKHRDGAVRPQKEDHAPIREALEALLNAVREALDDLRAGRRPSADKLEKARKRLLNALSASPLAPDLGLLQRFVRTAALEMVAALNSTETETGALLPLFEGHAKTLNVAREEATRIIGKPDAGFWEASI